MAADAEGDPPAKRWRKNMSWAERGRRDKRRDRSNRNEKRRQDAAMKRAQKQQVLSIPRVGPRPRPFAFPPSPLSLCAGLSAGATRQPSARRRSTVCPRHRYLTQRKLQRGRAALRRW